MIYISGAITAKTKKLEKANLEAGRKVAVALCKLGIPYFSPHLNTSGFEHESDLKDVTWQDYMDMDYEIIGRCSGMLMVDNWEGSKGAMAEREYAIKNNIPVFYTIQQILDHKPIGINGPYDNLEAANTEVRRLTGVINKAYNQLGMHLN